MALEQYTIDIPAFTGTLSTVQTEIDEIESAKPPLRTALDACKTTAGRTVVPQALESFWSRVAGVNTEAVITRAWNAHGGAGKVAEAYLRGDEAMADDGERQLTRLPEVEQG